MQTAFLNFLTKSTGDYDPSLFDLESYSTGNEDQVSQKEQIAEIYSFLNNVCKSIFSTTVKNSQPQVRFPVDTAYTKFQLIVQLPSHRKLGIMMLY